MNSAAAIIYISYRKKTKWNWTSSGIIGRSEIVQQNASYTDATL